MAEKTTFLTNQLKFREIVKNRNLLMMVMMLIGMSSLQAQDQIASNQTIKRPILSLHTGLHGVGLGLSRSISQHWSVALDYTYMEAGAEFSADLMGFRFVNSPYLKAQTVSASGRFSIKPNGRFNISAGLTWMDWNMEYGVANANALKLGNVEFSVEELGRAKLNSSNSWSVVPYLGIHLGRANPKTRVSMAMDLGFFYTNGMHITATGTGLSSTINLEEQKLQENFSTYRALPQINFQIRCKL